MKSPLSPSDIEVLLWCHSRAEPHPRLAAPAVHEAIQMYERCGMIEKRDVPDLSLYRTTAKGRAFIEALCKVSEPVPVWRVLGDDYPDE